jgi:hypothetical protein
LTSRVDVGVFATNGVTDSAPAILSVSFPNHQLRVYGPSDEGPIRLRSVDYDAAAREIPFDPVLHWSASWVDRPVHDASGSIVAWRRTARDGTETEVPHDPAAGWGQYSMDDTRAERPVLVRTGKPVP